MFKLDPAASYMMPAHFGPRPMSPRSSGWYRDVTSVSVAFETEPEALGAYLPAPFEVDDHAVVTVTYACNRNVDWLAGHGYNLIAVNAAAVYKGDQEERRGQYTLVMWENLADPILTGRELQGIPKIYADIPDHRVDNGVWHASASHFNHPIMDLKVENLRAPTHAEIEAYSAANADADNPMAWRFMPGISGFGTSISEPTLFPSEHKITSTEVGDGRVNWQHLTWEQNPTQCHIVNALAELPVRHWLPAIVASGSTNLILLDNLPRTLR